MNTKRNTKRVGTWSLSTINYSLLTIHSAQRRGISLMEVLASVFVIGIGLLGVLAVIPFGVYQVSKTNHADYASNMLKNAENEIRVRKLAVINKWVTATAPYRTTDTPLALAMPSDYSFRREYFRPATIPSTYSCDTYLLVDPFFEPGSPDIASRQEAANCPHVRVVGRGNGNPGVGGEFDRIGIWQELMRGQDDLLYTVHADRRTEFVDNRPTSSGNYTWFFMFRPESTAVVGGWTGVGGMKDTAVVDVLGCYNRVPGEARTVFARHVRPGAGTDFNRTLTGANITFRSPDRESLDISQTKYIFVSWAVWGGGTTMRYADGAWCQIVSAGSIEEERTSVALPESSGAGNPVPTTYKRTIFVVNTFPSDSVLFPASGSVNAVCLRGLIVPGVLYHKQIPDVPIK